ncbi:hypothetical protein V8G54_013686, partial [Vigna mungo]
MPERSELRTASCKGFMLVIVLCRCDYEEHAYSIASPAPRVYDRTVTFERAKPLGEKRPDYLAIFEFCREWRFERFIYLEVMIISPRMIFAWDCQIVNEFTLVIYIG